jgi:hypothetical protein
MSRIILLDSGPLGMVSNPKAKPPYLACQLWLASLLQNNETVILPEIADYEIRRELIRAGKTKGIIKLDQITADILSDIYGNNAVSCRVMGAVTKSRKANSGSEGS